MANKIGRLTRNPTTVERAEIKCNPKSNVFFVDNDGKFSNVDCNDGQEMAVVPVDTVGIEAVVVGEDLGLFLLSEVGQQRFEGRRPLPLEFEDERTQFVVVVVVVANHDRKPAVGTVVACASLVVVVVVDDSHVRELEGEVPGTQRVEVALVVESFEPPGMHDGDPWEHGLWCAWVEVEELRLLELEPHVVFSKKISEHFKFFFLTHWFCRCFSSVLSSNRSRSFSGWFFCRQWNS